MRKNPWKRQKIETLALLLKGALEAEAKVGLKMNIAEKNPASLLKSLPALRNPTISNLSLKGWVAVETIIDEADRAGEMILKLKVAGAEGTEYPLNKASVETARAQLPPLATIGLQRIKISVGRSKIDRPVGGDGRRQSDRCARGKRPAQRSSSFNA